MMPVAATAQSIAGSDPHPDVHLYAAADFGIDPEDVTFTKDIAPILQRSCQSCHGADGGAPMPLTAFAEVRPWARSIKLRTSIRDRMGAMPPFYLEKDLGIQEFKDDPSLSDEELAKIQAWADNGAPRGDPADMPPPREFAKAWTWTIGEPDLVLRSPEMTVPAIGPDRWGDLGLVPTGLTEDRYVKAVEIREVNNIASDTGSSTVGGRWVFHHMTYSAGVLNEEGTGIVDDTGRVGACAGAPVGAQPRPVVRHDAVGEAPKGAVGPVAGRKMVCVVMRASISCGRDYRRPSSPRLKPVRLRQGYGEISPLVR